MNKFWRLSIEEKFLGDDRSSLSARTSERGMGQYRYPHSLPQIVNPARSAEDRKAIARQDPQRFSIQGAIIVLLVLKSFVGVACAATDDIQLRASVDRRTILIGERIKYTIEAAYEEGIKLEFPKFKDDNLGEFEIKDSGSKLRKSLFGRRVYSKWYYITSFSVGRRAIPEIEVKYRQRAKEEWLVKKTRAIDMMVASVLPKTTQPSDIKDIKGPLYFFEIKWFYIASALVISSFIFSIIVYRRWGRKGPKRYPHETALEELEAMKNLLGRTGDIKGYYVGISDCIRRYIERAFRLRAPEMTTEEFLNLLRDSTSLSPEQKSALKDFLNACDLVKFAKYMPKKTEIESVYTTAKIFIEETAAIFTPLENKVL